MLVGHFYKSPILKLENERQCLWRKKVPQQHTKKMRFSLSKPFTLDRTVRLVIISTLVVLFVMVTKYLSPVLLPFFIAWLLAYLLYPSVQFVQKKMWIKNRSAAAALVLLTIIALITGALMFLIPSVVEELSKLKEVLVSWAQEENTISLPQEWRQYLHQLLVGIDVKSLLQRETLLSSIKGIFPHAWGLLNNTIEIIISSFIAFLVLLYIFFILKDYEKLKEGFVSMVPIRHKKFSSSLLNDMGEQMSKYYRGQALVAFIVGILFSIGFYLIGMPLCILMGVIIGVLNLVPYLQAISIPMTLLLMLIKCIETNESIGIGILSLGVVYAVVQLAQDLYITPKIMGKTMGLNPAIILLSLSIWGMTLGMLGLIIALPLTSLIISYYKRYILVKIEEAETTPEEPNIKEMP